jgi:hypothetical protein
MGYALRSGISFCRIGDRFLFLDLARDRYFALADAADRAFAALLAGDQSGRDDAARLVAQGLLVETPSAERPLPVRPPKEAVSSLLDLAGAASRGGGAAALARRLAASAELRATSLAGALSRLARRKERGACKAGAVADPLPVARAFAAAALIVPARDRCLATSLALAHRLVSLGHAPELVLGVKLRPFQAHCWVQLGAVLPGDRVDVVRNFTPILTV